MCGICGVVSTDLSGPPVGPPALESMRDALLHRGPDDCGAFSDAGVALGSRRLSILDLSPRGRMPMSTPDGRFTIVYNGEVYNFRELRRDLERQGVAFRSDGDTEVVLHALASGGSAALARFNGMFALALWDARERSLLLARDRLGIKPLYYVRGARHLTFASEPKALLAAGHSAEFDPGVWRELLCFRYTAGSRTVLRGIERLLPGHLLSWQKGEIRIRRWWSLADRVREKREALPEHPYAWYRETFEDAVRLRRISDVPLGVMLSGGLDSSAIAATMAAQADHPVAAFTVGFSERAYDESELARDVAARLGLEFHRLHLPVRDLLEMTRRASYLLDEPLAHTNDPHILALAAYAKSRVTVLLSGEGADETLNGYLRYQPLRALRLLRLAGRGGAPRGKGLLSARLRKLRRFLDLGDDSALVLYDACDVFPPDLEQVGLDGVGDLGFRRSVLEEAQALYPGEPLRQAMYHDQHTFLCSLLDRNDRMTMGASIECRVPFLDFRLVESVGALPTRVILGIGRRKEILRRALRDRLSWRVRWHRKWGFGVPWTGYLRREPGFREVVEALPTTEPIQSGPLDARRLRVAIDGFKKGDPTFEPLIRSLVMVAIWYDVYVRCGLAGARPPAQARAPVLSVD